MATISDEEMNQWTPSDAVNQIDSYYDDLADRVDAENAQAQRQQQYQGSEEGLNADPTQAEPQYQDNDISEYERIFQPFKASGKEVQVRNIDEAISLMQKGVDYTQKQQALKPRLNEMRTLEAHNMLGDNINYLVDLYEGNPQAIAKLIKDKNIDVNSLVSSGFDSDDTEKPYVPTNHKMSDEKVAFLDVVDELRANNSYDAVSSALDKWDDSSRQKFLDDPNKLLTLGNHISSGLYDAVNKELDHLRMVGDPRIQGMNDFDAYTAIGDAMLQQQQYAYAQQQQQAYAQQQQQYYQVQQQQQIQNRKASVAPTRPTVSPSVSQYDPLTMSDEEFSKLDLNAIYNAYTRGQ